MVLNDYIKITDTRLAFISTQGESKLFIMLMDFYDNNYKVQMRTYEHDISSYKMTKEFLRSNYGIESSLEPFLSDFKTLSYHRDGIDIEERTRRKIADY